MSENERIATLEANMETTKKDIREIKEAQEVIRDRQEQLVISQTKLRVYIAGIVTGVSAFWTVLLGAAYWISKYFQH